jgi:hypothetical protein
VETENFLSGFRTIEVEHFQENLASSKEVEILRKHGIKIQI